MFLLNSGSYILPYIAIPIYSFKKKINGHHGSSASMTSTDDSFVSECFVSILLRTLITNSHTHVFHRMFSPLIWFGCFSRYMACYAFTPPFQWTYGECNFPMIHRNNFYAFCEYETHTTYEHLLICQLAKDEGT